jgi:superfamily II DNA or RNA helicase
MPRIFDNIEEYLLPTLKKTLESFERADFCVGYFNLRGWRRIDEAINRWAGGENACCRLMIGMQSPPQDEVRAALRFMDNDDDGLVDQQTIVKLKRQIAEEFREQLTIGAPSNEDEEGLRRLSAQLKAKKVIVKLFLRHKLHAKLYLLHRHDLNNPLIGFLGSSNLTFAGLSKQGELNVDVLDHDACRKLEKWFNDRWNDARCLDISKELAEIIDTSWARETCLPPYSIYLKMAYHLSEEARAGLFEFRIPPVFQERLFEFQSAAVKIAAHHLNKRDGVLIGDVVGLGKTLMATALARIFQDDFPFDTLVLCPKNLVRMWQEYMHRYGLKGEVMSSSRVIRELPSLQRHRLLIIDESHNLRNPEGKRFKAIQEYIQKNESKCILLTATPYNKTYGDLSSQLRLFLTDEKDLGIRPERLLSEIGEAQFRNLYQCSPRSITAFEKSSYADDWRELMRLYMVRRTRSFIQAYYARTDAATERKYLKFADGTRTYFPTRVPRTVTFLIKDQNSDDPYARLYANTVVNAINELNLPRYGLGNYIAKVLARKPNAVEERTLAGLSRAGKRLMGFCRTNLFKRLESGGPAFIQSLERHILRNYVFLYAIEHGLDLPVGTQDARLLDARIYDEDADATLPGIFDEDEDVADSRVTTLPELLQTEADYQRRAAQVYTEYARKYAKLFDWLRPTFFNPALKKDLLQDARNLLKILVQCGKWNPDHDMKLAVLIELLTKKHPAEKVLIFTQFADTVHYLIDQLKARGITAVEGVTGDTDDPTELAWRFSPESNEKRDLIGPASELRILISTDVLSEGQNLQDASIIVSYDLPWAIIRLIQRTGRVDRIGQRSDSILCYTFVPADGVEQLIRLRARVRERLQQNAEVVGTDEAFFEDDRNDQAILDIYNEKAGILDGEIDTEVDLASYAYQIWKNAVDANPSLKDEIEKLPNVVFSTKPHIAMPAHPEGVLVYLRTKEGNDSLIWVDKHGDSVTQSQLAILQAAECNLHTPAIHRLENQHELVACGVKRIVEEEFVAGGQLGRSSGARYRVYQLLQRYADSVKGTLFDLPELQRAIDDIYSYPLLPSTADSLKRCLKNGINDNDLAELVIDLRAKDRLCMINQEVQEGEPHIICSLGLFAEHH